MTASRQTLVLLVEDEPQVRMLAVDGLEEAGFEVVEASNAQEAMEVLASRSDVGVLFTDINMPGKLDGLDLADFVHAHWPAIKLVATSGRPLPRPMPDDGRFISKPYSLQAMTELIGAKKNEP